jgi:hypothetical protein
VTGVKTVRTAFTEVEALILKGVLEGAGIPVLLRSNRVPGYEQNLHNEWGDLLVPDDRAVEATELIAGYLAANEEEGGFS